MITRDELAKLLNYDPDTGVWTWRVNRGRARKGSVAGAPVNYYGYHEIRIKPNLYRTSRLAFLWMMGRWPKTTIDHINGDRADDRWSNLREATRTQQNHNKPGWSKHGFKGVICDHRNGGRFVTRIVLDGKQVYLGCRQTAAEAHKLYCAAAVKRFGAFARTDHIEHRR